MDKYDAAIRKADQNYTGMTPNEKHDFETVCREHSSRGREAQRIRDGK